MLKRLLIAFIACLPMMGQIEGPSRVGVGVVQQKMTLADAVERAMRSNLDIEIEKTNISTSVAADLGARGFLDPHFSFSPRIEDRQTPTSSSLMGVDGKLTESVYSQTFGYNQRLPWWGSSLGLSVNNRRQTTTSPFSELTPYQDGYISANFTLPLIRNRRTDRDRANLRIANKQLDLSNTQFELKVIDVIARVEDAYWNLVAARENVNVAGEAVDFGREQLARTQRMIESGTLAPVELAASEAELERRIDTWYSAVGMVTEVENALKMLVTKNRDDTLWNDEIVPTDDRTLEPPVFEVVRDAVDLAVSRRPEMRQIGDQMETNSIQSALAADQTRPLVNLTAGYTTAGLAGTMVSSGNPFAESFVAQAVRLNELSVLAGLEPIELSGFSGGGTPESMIGGLDNVMSAIFRSRYPTTYVGVQFEFTGRNRAAQAEQARTAVTERRLELERARLEQLIAADVRNALQAIETARQRITAAEASVRASQEKLESEIRLFQNGESTNFLVLTRQNELADSSQRAIVARLDLNRAVARVSKALGQTLEKHNITLD